MFYVFVVFEAILKKILAYYFTIFPLILKETNNFVLNIRKLQCFLNARNVIIFNR